MDCGREGESGAADEFKIINAIAATIEAEEEEVIRCKETGAVHVSVGDGMD